MSSLECKNNEELQNTKESFLQSIKVNEDEETLRLMKLKNMYDQGEISESDIPKEDIKKIIEIYEEEISRIRRSTQNIKNKVKMELEQIKNSNN